MKTLNYLLVVASVCCAGTAYADPAPEPPSIPAINQGLLSHDGSWFAQLDGGGFPPMPLVTSADGTVQAGELLILTEADLDAVVPSLVLWKPAEMLPAGSYTVSFEFDSGTLEVDPTLDLQLAFDEATVSSEYLTTQNGEGAGGTMCCTPTDEVCGGLENCTDCWTAYNFLNPKAALTLPTFPDSLVVRAERGQGADTRRTVNLSGAELTAFGSFERSDDLCFDLDVVDSEFAVLQNEQRCGEITESPSDDELIREQPVPDTCASDPCVYSASSVEPDVMPNCPEEMEPPDLASPDLEPTDDESGGCGCGVAADGAGGGMLLVLAFLWARRRRRR